MSAEQWTPIIVTAVAPTLSYCVVNTNGREYLLACLDAIERTHPAGVEREILVLDNASADGSAEAVRARGGDIRLIALERRAGKAENDSTLMREAQGPLLPAAERGLGAASGGGGGTDRGARGRPTGGGGRRAAARLRRHAGALRLALPRRRHRPRRCAFPAPLADRAEQGRARPAGSTGPSPAPCSSDARPRPRSATWTPPSSSTTTSATSPSASPTRAGTRLFVPAAEADPPRPALDRPRRRPAPHRRIPPQPRPLHAQAPWRSGRPRGSPPHRLVLRPPRPRRPRPPRAPGEGLLGSRPPGAASRVAVEGIRDRARQAGAESSSMSSASYGLGDRRRRRRPAAGRRARSSAASPTGMAEADEPAALAAW